MEEKKKIQNKENKKCCFSGKINNKELEEKKEYMNIDNDENSEDEIIISTYNTIINLNDQK